MSRNVTLCVRSHTGGARSFRTGDRHMFQAKEETLVKQKRLLEEGGGGMSVEEN